MLIDPRALGSELEQLEEIEKASQRMMVQAISDYRASAEGIFREERDLVADIGEDITREALDKMGMSRIDQRLFGKMDYKQARYLFHPEYAVRQALFVDSKAEKSSGQQTATLQTSQFSMTVKQIRSRQSIDIPGTLPPVLRIRDRDYITTTIFVKYSYSELTPKAYALESITVAALPNGLLQELYNPNAMDSIWLAGWQKRAFTGGSIPCSIVVSKTESEGRLASAVYSSFARTVPMVGMNVGNRETTSGQGLPCPS